MRKMSMKGLLFAIPLSVCNAQTNGFVVSLTMPEEMLLIEGTPIIVSITNGSDRAIPIVKSERAFRFQIQLDVGVRAPHTVSPIEATDDRRKTWQSFNKVEDFLNPGESFSWTLPRSIDLTLFAYAVQATNITAKVLVGDNEWARSATQPFSISQEDYDGKGLLVTSPIIEFYDAKTKENAKTTIRKVKLGNRSFLFTDNGYRICEIGNDDTPEALLDSENGIISISFKNNKRQVRYNQNTRKIESDKN